MSNPINQAEALTPFKKDVRIQYLQRCSISESTISFEKIGEDSTTGKKYLEANI
jgi:hypothetical protein